MKYRLYCHIDYGPMQIYLHIEFYGYSHLEIFICDGNMAEALLAKQWQLNQGNISGQVYSPLKWYTKLPCLALPQRGYSAEWWRKVILVARASTNRIG